MIFHSQNYAVAAADLLFSIYITSKVMIRLTVEEKLASLESNSWSTGAALLTKQATCLDGELSF